MSHTKHIAHLSDTHLGFRQFRTTDNLGVNQRMADVVLAAEEAVAGIEKAHHERPFDLILHTGDLFHHPRPGFSSIMVAVSLMRRLTALGAPVILIPGNHDVSQLRTDKNVLDLVGAAIPELIVVPPYDAQGYPLGDDLWVSCWPTGSAYEPERFYLPEDDDMVRVFAGHGSCYPAAKRINGDYQIEVGPAHVTVTPSDWDYIALGDIHHGWDDGCVVMAGSTERFGWSDFGALPSWVEADATIGQPAAITRHPIGSARPMVRIHQGFTGTGFNTLLEADQKIAAEIAKHDRPIMVEVVVEDIPGKDLADTRNTARLEEYPGVLHVKHTFVTRKGVYINPVFAGITSRDQASIGRLDKLFEEFVAELSDLQPEYRTALLTRGLGALREAMAEADDDAGEGRIP